MAPPPQRTGFFLKNALTFLPKLLTTNVSSSAFNYSQLLYNNSTQSYVSSSVANVVLTTTRSSMKVSQNNTGQSQASPQAIMLNSTTSQNITTQIVDSPCDSGVCFKCNSGEVFDFLSVWSNCHDDCSDGSDELCYPGQVKCDGIDGCLCVNIDKIMGAENCPIIPQCLLRLPKFTTTTTQSTTTTQAPATTTKIKLWTALDPCNPPNILNQVVGSCGNQTGGIYIKCGDGTCVSFAENYMNCVYDCPDMVDEMCMPGLVKCDGCKCVPESKAKTLCSSYVPVTTTPLSVSCPSTTSTTGSTPPASSSGSTTSPVGSTTSSAGASTTSPTGSTSPGGSTTTSSAGASTASPTSSTSPAGSTTTSAGPSTGSTTSTAGASTSSSTSGAASTNATTTSGSAGASSTTSTTTTSSSAGASSTSSSTTSSSTTSSSAGASSTNATTTSGSSSSAAAPSTSTTTAGVSTSTTIAGVSTSSTTSSSAASSSTSSPKSTSSAGASSTSTTTSSSAGSTTTTTTPRVSTSSTSPATNASTSSSATTTTTTPKGTISMTGSTSSKTVSPSSTTKSTLRSRIVDFCNGELGTFIQCGDGSCVPYAETWQNCRLDCNDGVDEMCWDNEIQCDDCRCVSSTANDPSCKPPANILPNCTSHASFIVSTTSSSSSSTSSSSTAVTTKSVSWTSSGSSATASACSSCSPYATCNRTGSYYKCYCNAGFIGNGLQCAVGPCELNTANCSKDANCVPDPKIPFKYSCVCKSGFVGDGFTCTSADGCKTQQPTCDANTEVCVPTGQTTYRCDCGPNLFRIKGKCVTDPCISAALSCPANSVCKTLNETYSCKCIDDYFLSGSSCVLHPCAAGTDNCSANALCLPKQGTPNYDCACDDGYYGDGYKCIPDACLNDLADCPENSQCISQNNGSYTCRCNPNYYSKSGACILHPCFDTNFPPCSPQAKCLPDRNWPNLSEHYACSCLSPYTGNGTMCTLPSVTTAPKVCNKNTQWRCPISGNCIPKDWVLDNVKDCPNGEDENPALVDECALGKNKCDPMATCTNIPDGAYACKCKPGYVGNGQRCDLPMSTTTGPPPATYCPDGEDERTISFTKASALPTTPTQKILSTKAKVCDFQCTSENKCIPADYVLDRIKDCLGGEDEDPVKVDECLYKKNQCHQNATCTKVP
uniref:EGF-like domain-containing protein n=1 Tax=Romanomermis culicivorax TaxID=13658 RepID=A0A915KG38_ROMCU